MNADLKRLLPWLLLPLAIATLATLGSRAASGTGEPAPDFTAEIVAGEGVGDRVTLSSLVGEVVVLDFWASWCQPCRQSVPILNEVQREFPGVRFLGVNVEVMAPELVARHHQVLSAAFPSLGDPGRNVQQLYEIKHLPTLIVVDRAGIVQFRESGVPSADGLRQLLIALTTDPR